MSFQLMPFAIFAIFAQITNSDLFASTSVIKFALLAVLNVTTVSMY